MADQPHRPPQPDPRPEEPSVYGGQWGRGGEADSSDAERPDRPSPIKLPRESIGKPDPGTSAPTGN